MLIEAEAVVNVSFMYYNPLFRIQLTDTLHFAPGGGGGGGGCMYTVCVLVGLVVSSRNQPSNTVSSPNILLNSNPSSCHPPR